MNEHAVLDEQELLNESEFFMTLFVPLFEAVLVNASSDEQRWIERVKTFESLGLLDFKTTSPLKPKPVFDQFFEDANGERIYAFFETQLYKPLWHRRLLRKLRAPRPTNRISHRLPLYRDEIKDEKYRKDIAKVLAYKWVVNLKPGHINKMFESLMDVAALEHCLDTFRFNDISAVNIAGFLLRRLAGEWFDKEEKIRTRIELMRENLDLISNRAFQNLTLIEAENAAQARLGCASIVAETHADCDALLAEIRKNLAVHQEECARRIDLLKPDEDADESFRRAVNLNVKRRKDVRKRYARMLRRHPAGFVRWVAPRLALSTIALLFAVNLKVGASGIMLVQFICRWLT